ncbi:MAG: hypothetical protein JWM27_4962 [Gemmatimonadetes bacterium]|nr:hypothetical protein [Gemmatimonadota bacterium]
MKQRDVQITIRVTNNLSVERQVILEPWATEYCLTPGNSVDVAAAGNASFPLEVEVFENRIIVHCFDSQGATMSFVQ